MIKRLPLPCFKNGTSAMGKVKQEILDKYEVVIGLEIHAQLQTESKIFASDATQYGQAPNTNISLLTFAHPGTLPVLNEQVPRLAIKMGLACGCEITRYNIFDRKNYFYPDLPKGYQITQDRAPICVGGSVFIRLKDGEEHEVKLNRIHMEEDAGKSLHMETEAATQVDLNRAGVPLIEIVSEPALRSGEEAAAYLGEVRKMVRYLEICDGNMEEGSLRADANISVRLKGETALGQKVEVKNMNSIRNLQRAVEYEFVRQVAAIENGEAIVSETRTFNAQEGTTASMRKKETLTDYRYFPDPDLPPYIVSDELLNEIEAEMPKMPRALYLKFMENYGLPAYDVNLLTETKALATYFEDICKLTKHYKGASNWLMGPIKSYLNEQGIEIEDYPLDPERIAEVIGLVEKGVLSFTVASQKLLPLLLKQPTVSAQEIAQAQNLLQESGDDFILPIVEEVLAQYPDKVAIYKKGKKGLLGMFMGEVMKKTKGKADPKKTSQVLKEILDK